MTTVAMKKLFTLLTFLLCAIYVQAGHIAGGELYYKYIGPGAVANSSKYEVTLRLFRECNPPPGPNGTQVSGMPGNVILGIFQNGSATLTGTIDVARTDLQFITLSKPSACIVNAPQVCYQVGSYTTTVELNASGVGYTIAFQTCCRTNGIVYILGASVGATYTAEIPPSTFPSPFE